MNGDDCGNEFVKHCDSSWRYDFVSCSVRCYGYRYWCRVEACSSEGCNSSSQFWVKALDSFSDTRMGGPYSSFMNNFGAMSSGFSSIVHSSFTLEQLREARASMEKEDSK